MNNIFCTLKYLTVNNIKIKIFIEITFRDRMSLPIAITLETNVKRKHELSIFFFGEITHILW